MYFHVGYYPGGQGFSKDGSIAFFLRQVPMMYRADIIFLEGDSKAAPIATPALLPLQHPFTDALRSATRVLLPSGLACLGPLTVRQTLWPRIDSMAGRISEACAASVAKRDTGGVVEANQCLLALLVSNLRFGRRGSWSAWYDRMIAAGRAVYCMQ